jgi:Rieske Fe-S protein
MAHDDLPNNEGRLLADQHVALYRDGEGKLHATTSVCTHRGCDVHWDAQSKLWACPCHGSRFSPMGEVVRGPAARPLAPVDIPE